MLFITGLVILCFSPVPTLGATHKILYLTFDDGPSQRYTPQVLNILKREHVHATFFVLGFRCDEFPELVSRIHTEGHEIGNHGYYHRFIIGQSRTELESDLLRTDQAVFHACGIKPKYFRPPGGKSEESLSVEAAHLGHPVRLWTVDSEDWKAPNAKTIIHNVTRSIQPNSVILLHDGVSNSRFTVQALVEIIQFCKKAGYEFRVL